MHKHIYELLQEFSRQRPSSRHKSQCFSTKDQNVTAKISLSPKDKRLKNYVLVKLNKIQADKQALISKKQKTIQWYKMILDKMVSPFIEYMPSVTTSYHLSKLSDFRTYGTFSEQSEETGKKKMVVRPKCVEEPLPILIKPEYKVLKSRKKEWKIINKLAKARDSKNELIKKYKIWKSKITKEPENQKKIGKNPRPNAELLYDLFLKDAVESKIGDLMPSIKAKYEHSNVYDFRFKNEPEFEQFENHLKLFEGVVISPKRNVSIKSHLSKSLNRGKTVIPKPLHTKTNNKTDPITVKTKPYEKPALKKKEEKVQVLNVKPGVHLKEEIHAKPPVQRSLHKQNWAKSESDGKIKVVKPDTTKEKLVTRKTGVPPTNKKPAVVQLLSSDKSPAEIEGINRAVSVKQNIEEKEDKTDVSNIGFAGTENLPELVQGKSHESGPLHNEIKSKETILQETRTPEKSDKHSEIESEEYRVPVNDSMSTHSKAVSSNEALLEHSDSLRDFKSNITLDEPNRFIKDSKSFDEDVCFVQGSDVDKSVNQNLTINEISKSTTDNLNKNFINLSERDTKVANSLVLTSKSEEDKKETLDNNVLTNTYLVSFTVNDDEAFLKTRSQVIADEIKGDLIDLNIVLEEEKRAREGNKKKTLSEYPKSTNHNVNLFSNTNLSDSLSLIKNNVPTLATRNKENMKINTMSVIGSNQNVSTESFANNSPESENTSSCQTSSHSYTNKDTQTLKKISVSDDGPRKLSDIKIKTKMLEPNKENIIGDDEGNAKSDEVALIEINAEQQKAANKTHSLELIEQKTTEKGLKHEKHVKENEKNIHSTGSIAETRQEKLNKTQRLHNKEKYQEIINSVKNIIPSMNSNENILGKNTNKVLLTGAKLKTNAVVMKNYTKTINELKEIISELPGGDNEHVIGTAKLKQSHQTQSVQNKTSKEYNLKTVEAETNLKDVNSDSKQSKIKSKSKTKRINLKTIKIVDKIDHVIKDQKSLSADKIVTEATLPVNKGTEDKKTNLKLFNTSGNKHLINDNQPGSQIKQKENTKENRSNLSLNAERMRTIKHQRLSKLSDKNDEPTPSKEEHLYPERTRKAKSVINIKLNERKTGSMEEPTRINVLRSKSTKDTKSDVVKPSVIPITGVTNTFLKKRNKSVGDITNNPPKNKSLGKTKEKEIVHSDKIDIQTTPDKKRSLGHSSKATDSKISSFKEKGSSEYSATIRAKSDLSINKIESLKIKVPKRINTSPESVKSGVLERDLSVTGTGLSPGKIANKLTGESRENKLNPQQLANKMDDDKTISNETEKLKFVMDKIVKSAENSIGNQRKIIKFTRMNETVKRNKKIENNLIKTKQKDVQSVNTLAEKLHGIESLNKQTCQSPEPIQMPSHVLQAKNKKTELKTEKKETQPTGILPRKTLKVQTLSNENLSKRKLSVSTDDGNTLPKSSVQSRIQAKSADRKNEELLNVRERLENSPPEIVLKKRINIK